MDKYQELKAEYDALIALLREYMPDVEQEAVLTYYIAAVMKIWGSNLLYSPDYAAALAGITGKRHTLEQIVTAMGCCSEPARCLQVPAFIQEPVRSDARNGTSTAARIVEKLNDLLVASAMINGDFTLEEANAISQIMEGLIEFAASEGVTAPDIGKNTAKVTARKQDSYLQNDALLAGVDKNEPQEATAEAPSQEDSSNSPISIHLELTLDDEETASLMKALDDQPKRSAAVTLPKTDDGETMESLLAELDGLVGLDHVKQDVHSLMNFIRVIKIREQRGKKAPIISYHLVFTGNPGTGKTTVARLVARLYYHMGILPQGQLVETDRSGLVAGYLGQTAIKTQKVIQEAMGGVLFIDEAYSLAEDNEDSYGREAIETLLKAMEDHRDELVVIVAGYTELMHKFIDSNPGLSSRFSKYFEFPDYTGEELLAIFKRFCDKNGYALDSGAVDLLRQEFEAMYSHRPEHFGNARTARNLFEKAISAQADRIVGQDSISDDDLEIITARDIAAAIGGVR